jgi:hypothetical protein
MEILMATDSKTAGHGEDHLNVQVITPSGIFPDDEKWRRVRTDETVADLLDKAAKKLKLTNVSDWVAFVGTKELNISQSFASNGLAGDVEIEWHKREGGGGAC